MNTEYLIELGKMLGYVSGTLVAIAGILRIIWQKKPWWKGVQTGDTMAENLVESLFESPEIDISKVKINREDHIDTDDGRYVFKQSLVSEGPEVPFCLVLSMYKEKKESPINDRILKLDLSNTTYMNSSYICGILKALVYIGKTTKNGVSIVVITDKKFHASGAFSKTINLLRERSKKHSFIHHETVENT